jgi:hypothetical protein
MNKETFLELSIESISQVYMGKRRHCRCGCGGEYTATSYMKEPRSTVDDMLVYQRLKRAKMLVLNGADVDYGQTYIDVQTGENRSLTFYTDELL